MTTVYLCEKPSQGRDIANVLGCHQRGEGFLYKSDTFVTWCYGHLLEAAPPGHYCKEIKPWRLAILPIVPNQWEIQVKTDAKKQFTVIKNLLEKSDTLIIATDADREGEVIAREIVELCGFKGKIKRLWLSALDETSIKRALTDLRDGTTTENLYYAGLGRQRADWLIGMNLTMAASVLYGKNAGGVLSVGRVQTPTLKLVVDRDHAIEHFQPTDYYDIMAQFTNNTRHSFLTKWQPKEELLDPNGHCVDKTCVTKVIEDIQNKTGEIIAFDEKEKQQSAPLGLSLSQLQKLASSKFNYSAQQTLMIAQSLYETHKATTYPRSDCSYLPESQLHDAKIILTNLAEINGNYEPLIRACNITFRSPIWNDKKITAHHAIIPTTNPKVLLDRMSKEERELYDLICRYYIAQFLGDYRYVERSVVVDCGGETFKATHHAAIDLRWKCALGQEKGDIEDNKENADEDKLSTLPKLTIGENLQLTSHKMLSKKTQPPSRFTEGTLIEAMKSIGKTVSDNTHKKILKDTAGIGTEATRAGIIETLFKRGYLEKKGKQIQATAKGKSLISYLPNMVSDPVLTATWEQQLEEIANGKANLAAFMQDQKTLITNMITQIAGQ